MRHPLIVFYILTIVLLIYDVNDVICSIKGSIDGNWMIFYMDMPAMLKALIGVE